METYNEANQSGPPIPIIIAAKEEQESNIHTNEVVSVLHFSTSPSSAGLWFIDSAERWDLFVIF